MSQRKASSANAKSYICQQPGSFKLSGSEFRTGWSATEKYVLSRGSEVRPGIVGSRVRDVAVMRSLKPVDRNWPGDGVLGHVCSWTSWRRAYIRDSLRNVESMQLGVQELGRQASVEHVCSADKPWRSTLVATCP